MIHIIPLNDLSPHEETTTCKCEPTLLKEGDEFIVVHNSYDGREAVEWAEEIIKNK